MNTLPELEARAAQIKEQIKSTRMRASFIAESRCPQPKCGRLLAAALLLPDGYWLWYAGWRLSRDESLRALHWYYMGLTEPEEWLSEAEYYEGSLQAALEDLPNHERLGLDVMIMKVIPPDDRSDLNPLPYWFYQTTYSGPDWTPRGVTLWEGSMVGLGFVTCGCHRNFRVQVHEFFRVIAEHATSSSRTRVHIPVASVR